MASTETFALFASNKEFKKAHPNPFAYVHVSEEGGRMIAIKKARGIRPFVEILFKNVYIVKQMVNA
jgi:hypothetical protein